MFVEQLENRQLLSGNGENGGENGDCDIFKVEGTNQSDCIIIKKVGAKIVAKVNGCRTWEWADDVDKIVVCAGNGKDKILVLPSVCIDTALFGENGKDLIVGGSGDDFISGGNGKDTLSGGLDGCDTLVGGNGKDTIVNGWKKWFKCDSGCADKGWDWRDKGRDDGKCDWRENSDCEDEWDKGDKGGKDA